MQFIKRHLPLLALYSLLTNLTICKKKSHEDTPPYIHQRRITVHGLHHDSFRSQSQQRRGSRSHRHAVERQWGAPCLCHSL